MTWIVSPYMYRHHRGSVDWKYFNLWVSLHHLIQPIDSRVYKDNCGHDVARNIIGVAKGFQTC